MKETRIKQGLLILCMLALVFPFVEMLKPMADVEELKRYDLVSKVEEMTTENWFDGSYQESAQKYINDNIGFFPLFVKFHNQLEYTLFDNIYTGNVVRGKNKILYAQGYLDSHAGKDFLGYNRIEETTHQLKKLQDTLHDMGKFLMVCLAANKTTYFPEYMPDSTQIDSTNHDSFVELFKANGINYMNCDNWFLKMKDSLGYLLYPPYGVHWSNYSSVLVADSLAKYISKKTNWPLADLQITKKTYSPKTRFFDNDIAHSMNLFSAVEPDSMLYVEYVWTKPEKPQPKRKIFIVGDSFTWDIFENTRFGKDCFDDIEFWYYNQTSHTLSVSGVNLDWSLPVLTRHLDLLERLHEFDAFLILTNAPNLEDFAWGFVDDALNTLADSNYVREERKNDFLLKKSDNLKAWRLTLQKMADDRDISLDSMIQVYLHDRNFTSD